MAEAMAEALTGVARALWYDSRPITMKERTRATERDEINAWGYLNMLTTT